jgi:hypothetical protein
VFHVDVAKVDRDVAYVAMVIHVCCKRLFQMFHLFVANVFIWMSHMFQVFYLVVAHAFTMAFQVFSCVFCKCVQTHVSYFSSAFRRMLQMFYLFVLKVDLVLLLGNHLPQSRQRK